MSELDNILLEDMNDKLDAILEGQQAMTHVPGDVAKLKEDMSDVKDDIATIKLAVTYQAEDHKMLKQRVTKLEHGP